VSNEMYYHKVVATLVSNSWVDVPVQSPATETLHDSSERVAIVICCGVDESRTYRVRVADLHKVEVSARPSEAINGWIKCSERMPELPKGGGKAWVIAYTPARKAQSAFNGARFLYWNGIDWRYGDGSRLEHRVTHWQPHLTPPTE